jgi:hypothetical protein
MDSAMEDSGEFVCVDMAFLFKTMVACISVDRFNRAALVGPEPI